MKKTILIIIISLSLITFINGQTTEFTYQGRLVNSSVPATGNFDFEFALFDAVSGGTQKGTTLTRSNVAVNGGIFTVKLDFGDQFDGGARFLEIKVRANDPTDTNPYSTLNPRQAINSTPYAIKSKTAENATNATNAQNAQNSTNAQNADNADKLGGLPSSQFVQTNDSRLSDARNPLPGNGSYIQNRPVNVFPPNPQPSSSFFISGTGKAQNFDAQFFSSNGVTILSYVGGLSIGDGAGANATGGDSNINIGQSAGENNSGQHNLFVGGYSGYKNTGTENTFLGHNTGLVNTSGDNNVFIGWNTGRNNTTGDNNSFLGYSTGLGNLTGSNNTLLGNGANVNSGGLIFATAIGAGSEVLASNRIALGRTNGSDDVEVYGRIKLNNLGSGGPVHLCRNAFLLISSCSSSLRYKKNIAPFNSGLSLINKLKPITFDWKVGGMADLGLGAEDVAKIEPLLVTYNDKGQVEGVKYDRIGVVLLNAVKEQQAQIESQKKRLDLQTEQITKQTKLIENQQLQINVLKAFICAGNSTADFCQTKEK